MAERCSSCTPHFTDFLLHCSEQPQNCILQGFRVVQCQFSIFRYFRGSRAFLFWIYLFLGTFHQLSWPLSPTKRKAHWLLRFVWNCSYLQMQVGGRNFIFCLPLFPVNQDISCKALSSKTNVIFSRPGSWHFSFTALISNILHKALKRFHLCQQSK